MNYYCLIAGLPDIHVEDTKTVSSLIELKQQMLNEVSAEDAKLVKLLFSTYDNANFLAYLKNKEAEFSPAGNLTPDDFAGIQDAFHEEPKIQKKSVVPLYIQQFYLQTLDETFSFEGVTPEDYLAGKFYESALKTKNEFLRNWFEFNLNISNLLTAITCRKHGFNHKLLVVGDNDVATLIRQSNARDFGLSGDFEYYDVIARIAEEPDLLEREKKIDALKWEWLEENTFFKYFSIEKILVYLLKIQMLERWKILSIEKGTQIFRELLEGMKEGVKFETV